MESKTSKFLTKYERAKILGTRASQISRGAPTNITGLIDPFDIANEELKTGTCPLIIRRNLPDGTYEDWKPGKNGKCSFVSTSSE